LATLYVTHVFLKLSTVNDETKTFNYMVNLSRLNHFLF